MTEMQNHSKRKGDMAVMRKLDKVVFTSAISGKEENPYKNIIDNVVKTCDNFYAMILNKNLMKVMIDNVS